ncbi:hypothetical protein EVAR_93984_1 [Eumeta japonica]|uniref:Uncharacterized protein n=1 Tax=Eumeta variegata TaxID=151549 RepID=A0A4C1TPA9_EUMVA|nr:hypothetical protein EVAR_93984_1 [Eumeta japonica]
MRVYTREDKSNKSKYDEFTSFRGRRKVVTGPPVTTFRLHRPNPANILASEYRSTCEDQSNEPKLDNVTSFNTEFLWLPFGSIIRTLNIFKDENIRLGRPIKRAQT